MIPLAIGAAVLILLCVVLPIVAIYRTRSIRALEARLAVVETMLRRPPVPARMEPEPALAQMPEAVPAIASPRSGGRASLETLIGQKLIGWIAISLIFLAACFFLKYAFENRWIGELGRVALEVCAGVAFTYAGFNRYRKGWTLFSQVLTSGGITILYLSIYGAFAYYHLLNAPAAFALLVITVAEAYLLSIAYNARSIAIMATLGGFLVPILLSTGRDQYATLFVYISALDAGVLAVVIARRWRWISSLAYGGTQALFCTWYEQHYHPEKRLAVLLFQLAVLLIFLAADATPRFRKVSAGWEEWVRLAVNPFVFYGVCYALYNSDHHEWMGVLAIAIAILYATLARRELARRVRNDGLLFATIGTALSFVSLAIPVQLNGNWIAIAWAAEAAVFVWAARGASASSMRWFSAALFALALGHYIFWDTPWNSRPLFTPIFSRYFFETLALVFCLGAAAWQSGGLVAPASGRKRKIPIVLALLGAAVLCWGCSVEAYTYFDSRVGALSITLPGRTEAARQLRWAGQLSLSLLWSIYAVLLTAAGFRFHLHAFRSAGLLLFGITLVKLVLIDTSELAQFYRIVAFLAVGLLLLGVAWTYQRALKREPTS